MTPKLSDDRFKELEKRKIWSKNKFNINREGNYREVAHIFDSKKLGELIDPLSHINYDLVREFYANSLSSEDEPFTFTTFVRGRNLRFGGDQINVVLGEPPTLELGMLDEYILKLNRHKNIEEISSSILLQVHIVQYNASGVAMRYLREDMKPTA
ncbi:hypothetical protein KIW84_045919 [Lathyrus oleraceus]|uniref:Uncharacterized protein n=1 Tax=Pisum sativum TaxID=3888 RepID=A0A9D4XPD7_PEA|nr:hypothetical protein KIW84_045919 [Pisum sativum]